MKQTLLLEHFIARKPNFTPSTATRKRRRLSHSDSSSSPEPHKKTSLAQDSSPEIPAVKGDKAVETLSGKDITTVLGRVKRVPGVSTQTQDILSRLNRRYGERNTTTLRDALDGVSAKDKYADLLGGARELILPYKYKKLISLLEIIDLELTSAEISPVPFEKMQAIAEEKLQTEFSLMDLQRILMVYPEAYEIRWMYLEHYLSHQICVVLPESRTHSSRSNSNTLTLRKELLKSKLLEVTKQHHQAFLNTLPVKPKINFSRLKVWYHEFDVHNIPDIELAPLPVIPQEPELTPEISLIEHSEVLSLEEPISEVIKTPANSISIKVQRMTHLTESLNTMYSSHTKPSQFLHLVLRKLSKSILFLNAPEDLEKDVRDLIRMFPGWLRLIKTSTGEVLRMNRENDYLVPVIKEELRKRFY